MSYKKSIFLIDNVTLLKKTLPTLIYSESDTPAINQFSFNNDVININSAAGVFGAISYPVFNLRKGDIVRVSCEIYSESGTLPKIALDKHTGGNIDNTNNYVYLKNNWQIFDESFNITTNDKDFKVICGLFTADVGTFKVRKLKITVLSDTCVSLPDKKHLTIRRNAGTWEVDSRFTTEPASFVVSTNHLEITLSKTFRYFGLPVVTIGDDFGTTINARVGSTTNQKISVRFYDKSGNLLLMENVPDMYIYMSVTQVF